MRLSWLFLVGAASVAITACSIYGEDLLTGSGSTGTGSTGATAGSAGATGGASTSGGAAGNGAAGGTTSDGGSTGTMTSPACTVAGDCPGQDTECRTRTCDMGACGFDNAPLDKALSMQTKGDCKKVVCDGMGNTSTAPDDSDLPDDANDCTTDTCKSGLKTFTPNASGDTCVMGGKLCDGAGKCVACLVDGDCATMACNAAHNCVAAQCDDKKKNGSETDIDCGDTCPPCDFAKGCVKDSDCKGGKCEGSACAATCIDGLKNGPETDVDCGGGTCPTCATNKGCAADGDCSSGKCDGATCTDVLLLSQVQTRGSNGGNDELVEIYNPTAVSVTFDATWSVKARSAVGLDAMTCQGAGLGVRFSGAGQIVPPHHHLLYVNGSNPGYNGPTPGDGSYTTGITDAASVVLFHGGKPISSLCFGYDATTIGLLTSCAGAPYLCEGAPATNPHNNAGGSNIDASLERKPGGAAGNGQSTNDNATDFFSQAAPEPRNLSSPAAP